MKPTNYKGGARKDIILGSEVQDISTGFKGLAVSRLDFINGCTQYCVQPPMDKDGKRPEGCWLDWQYLRVIGPGVSSEFCPLNTGGPSAKAPTTYGH